MAFCENYWTEKLFSSFLGGDKFFVYLCAIKRKTNLKPIEQYEKTMDFDAGAAGGSCCTSTRWLLETI